MKCNSLVRLLLYHFFFICQGVFHTFLKVRGRERPHRDLNPFPHWLAEVNLSLPLTIIIISLFLYLSIGFLKKNKRFFAYFLRFIFSIE